MAGKEIEKVTYPITLDNSSVLEGLNRVGLSVQFPIKLRALNDVLANRRSSFAGLRITLDPASDDPTPIVEVKRRSQIQIRFDIDADRFNPTESKGFIEIVPTEKDSIICQQRFANTQQFLRDVYGEDSEILLKQYSDITRREQIVGNFLRMSIVDYEDEGQVSPINFYSLLHNEQEEMVRFRAPHIGIGEERLLWLNHFHYEGSAADIERVLDLTTQYFSYDPDNDPAVRPDRGD